jgi:hypothetical protein
VVLFSFLWALLCKRKGEKDDNDGLHKTSSFLIVSFFLSLKHSLFPEEKAISLVKMQLSSH